MNKLSRDERQHGTLWPDQFGWADHGAATLSSAVAMVEARWWKDLPAALTAARREDVETWRRGDVETWRRGDDHE